MKDPQYTSHDPEGQATLDAIAKANSFNRWMYETIRPYCKGRILEVGSGIGNISEFLLSDHNNVTLTDISEEYCEILTTGFGTHSSLEQIAILDIIHDDFETEYQTHLGQYDTILIMNVIEHLADDQIAIRNLRSLLRPDGHLVILVPAYSSLYNRFDKELRHYRRYTRNSLIQLISKGGLQVMHFQNFNLAGIPGWFIFGGLLRHKVISSDLMSTYNRLVPLFRAIDKLTLNTVGLSLIAVSRIKH